MPNVSSPRYNPDDFPPFAVTVDVALFTIRNGTIHIGLVRRGEWPFEGRWALPGGFVRQDEDLDQAATRELAEETGLRQDDDWYLEQFASYGAPARDPRMRVVTVAYLAVCAEIPALEAGGDAALAQLTPFNAINTGALAFDHSRIVEDALERVRSMLEYTTFATLFLPSVFTIGDVREVYETVWNTRLHKGNFQRSFRRNAGCFVEQDGPPPGRIRRPGRPARRWWSVKTPYRRDEPLAFLEHALVAPSEAWRQRRDRALARPAGAY